MIGMSIYSRLQVLVAAFILLLGGACSGGEDEILTYQSMEVAITAGDFSSIKEGMTRTVDEGYHTSFKDGDEVGIFVIDNTTQKVKQSNLRYKYSASTLIWQSIDTEVAYYENAYYLVYYPYMGGIDESVVKGTKNYSENADAIYSVFVRDRYDFNQGTQAAYSSKDLMIGKADVSKGNDGLPRVIARIEHRLALILVNMRQRVSSGGTKAVKPGMKIGYDVYGWMTPDSVYRLLIKPLENIRVEMGYPSWDFAHSSVETVNIAPGKYVCYNITIPE